MLQIKINNIFINPLLNYSVIIRKIKKHFWNKIKSNAYATILSDEKNNKIKIIISHVSKKQCVNIIKKFKLINK